MVTTVDLAVVGGGPAGYAAALRARELGASVALIEAQHIGGHCVHYACIPSTVMLDSARRVMEAQEIALAGVIADPAAPSFARATARASVLSNALAQGIEGLLKSRGVQLIEGRATFRSATALDVQLRAGGEETVTANATLLATGARYEPQALGRLPANDQLSPDEALALSAPPETTLVIGGGAAGLSFAWEYASVFAVFGARVVLLDPSRDGPLGFDATIAGVLAESLRQFGVVLYPGAEITDATREGDAWAVEFSHQDATGETSNGRELAGAVIRPDARVPVSDVPGLGELAVVGDTGFVSIDARGATSADGLFAAGDVTGPPMLSSVAEVQGRVAAENALGGDVRADLSLVPLVLHTEPEVASVGLSEAAARDEGYEVRTGVASAAANGRIATLGRRDGLVKLVADGESGELLGVHIAAPFASEAIAQGVACLQLGATLADLARMTHWHPSVAESLTQAARAALR